MTILFKDVFDRWDDLNHDNDSFIKYLKRNKWKKVHSDGCWKHVFCKDGFILKFDIYPDIEKGCGKGHTYSEYLSWRRSSKKRKMYMCPSIIYYKGLLIQPLLENVNNSYYGCDSVLKKLAQKLRFSHFWSYGFLNGKVKWFDTDSLGSGWYACKKS